MYNYYFPKTPQRLRKRMFVSACKEMTSAAIVALVLIGAMTIIPVMMIVYGARNPTVACTSPCVLQECDFPVNTPYILPTPAIGITTSQAVIIGGVFGIVLECAFAFFAMTASREKFFSPILLLPTIPFLFSVAWMIVSFIVYSQTIELCTTYNKLWSVDMTVPKWLLGANIGGCILLLGPYVIPFALKAVSAPCSNGSGTSDPTNFAECMCPQLHCLTECCLVHASRHEETTV